MYGSGQARRWCNEVAFLGSEGTPPDHPPTPPEEPLAHGASLEQWSDTFHAVLSHGKRNSIQGGEQGKIGLEWGQQFDVGSQEGICTDSHLFTHQTTPCQSLALPMAQALLARMLSALQHHCHHTHTPALSPVSWCWSTAQPRARRLGALRRWRNVYHIKGMSWPLTWEALERYILLFSIRGSLVASEWRGNLSRMYHCSPKGKKNKKSFATSAITVFWSFTEGFGWLWEPMSCTGTGPDRLRAYTLLAEYLRYSCTAGDARSNSDASIFSAETTRKGKNCSRVSRSGNHRVAITCQRWHRLRTAAAKQMPSSFHQNPTPTGSSTAGL